MKNPDKPNENGKSSRSSVGQSSGFLKPCKQCAAAKIADYCDCLVDYHPEQNPESGQSVAEVQLTNNGKTYTYFPAVEPERDPERAIAKVIASMGPSLRRGKHATENLLGHRCFFIDPIFFRSAVYIMLWKHRVVYVGMARRLAKRIFFHELRRKIHFDDILFVPCRRHELSKLEMKFIKAFKPRYNRGGIAKTVKASDPDPYEQVLKRGWQETSPAREDGGGK